MEREFMARAIELGRIHMRTGEGGPFGAVVVKDGEIVSEGFNEVLSGKDPTAHAEVVAIRRAASRLDSVHLEGCEIYASCEPCPMCLGAIYWARIEAGSRAPRKTPGRSASTMRSCTRNCTCPRPSGGSPPGNCWGGGLGRLPAVPHQDQVPHQEGAARAETSTRKSSFASPPTTSSVAGG